jgi:hypothetical protein
MVCVLGFYMFWGTVQMLLRAQPSLSFDRYERARKFTANQDWMVTSTSKSDVRVPTSPSFSLCRIPPLPEGTSPLPV